MIYWYVLFVLSGKECKTEKFIKERDWQNHFTPFIPILETLFKKGGVVKKETEYLFPGYVFIETELETELFLDWITPLLHENHDIIRLLSYDDSDEYALREEEKQGLLGLCNADKFIEASTGVIIGDRIFITEGALIGREGIIRKINRHKMTAWVEVDFMGCARSVQVALNVLEKYPAQNLMNYYM